MGASKCTLGMYGWCIRDFTEEKFSDLRRVVKASGAIVIGTQTWDGFRAQKAGCGIGEGRQEVRLWSDYAGPWTTGEGR